MKFNNRNVFISPSAQLGKNVRIGDDTVIYDNVIIGDNTTICNNSVIGEPVNDYYEVASYINPETIIGNNCLIRSHAIIYAGCNLGNYFSSGHRITIRENSVVGEHCRVGTLADIQGNLQIGNYCWLHSNVFIPQYSKIHDFAFLYPHVILTNDPHPPSIINKGPEIFPFAQIGAGSLIGPGVKIGPHALIGAGSNVMKNIDAYKLAFGNPAKEIKDVREIFSKQLNQNYYPWPYQFSRQMPWEDTGFDNWLAMHPEYN